MRRRFVYLIVALLICVAGAEAEDLTLEQEKGKVESFLAQKDASGETNYTKLGFADATGFWDGLDNGVEIRDGHITQIYWPDKGLTGNLDVSGFTKLGGLYCYNNNLTELDVSGCEDLIFLSCYDNNLTELDVSGCTGLYNLYCSENNLTELDVSGCTGLDALSCYFNNLTELVLNTALTHLYCGYNNLTKLDASGCAFLEYLYCYFNNLTKLDISGCTYLRDLRCNDNNLTALDVSGCTALGYLHCSNNYLPESLEEMLRGQFVGSVSDFSFSPQKELPVVTYHRLTLEIAPGIDCYGLSAGSHQVADGDHLHLQFLADDRTVGPDDVILLIDGVDTPFTVPAAGSYYGYILNPIHADHTILIALREYTVTLPETAGVTFTPAAGTHRVPYGEAFSFSLSGEFDPAALHVFANGIEIQPNALRSLTQSYTIDRVIGPVTISIDGYTTGNLDIAHGAITLSIINSQLSIINSGSAVDVAIYNITGQNVVHLRALRGSRTLALPAGVYIVRAGEERWKVVVD